MKNYPVQLFNSMIASNPLKQYRFVNRTFKKYWSVYEFAFPDYVNEQQWQLVSVSKLVAPLPV